jgi:hypothetical protein
MVSDRMLRVGFYGAGALVVGGALLGGLFPPAIAASLRAGAPVRLNDKAAAHPGAVGLRRSRLRRA